MARKTNGEKLDELEKQVATLRERIDNTREDLQGFAELRTQVAVLEERLDEVKRGADESGRRLWLIVPALIGAVIGGLMMLAVQLVLYFIRGN